MTIGERIKKRREILGIAQTELAEKVKMSKQTIYKYENGIITNIPSDKIEAIAKALDVSPGYLMGWEAPLPDDAELFADMLGDQRLLKYMSIVKNMDAAQKEQIYSYIEFVASKK